MSSTNSDWQQDEKPLSKVGCRDSDCEKDLHTFLIDRGKPGNRNKSYRSEKCTVCDADIVDWDRLDRHDLSDVQYTIQALEYEYVRHRYWDAEIDEKAINHALRIGLSGLRMAAEKRLRKYIAPPRKDNGWDGRQTPKQGNVIFYAQHATATCCRPCIEAWHRIDRNRPLNESQQRDMIQLIMLYIEKKMPDLKESGEYVPPIRKIKSA